MLITHWKMYVWPPDLAHRFYGQFYEMVIFNWARQTKILSFSHTGAQKCSDVQI